MGSAGASLGDNNCHRQHQDHEGLVQQSDKHTLFSKEKQSRGIRDVCLLNERLVNPYLDLIGLPLSAFLH